ncbi:alpha/beta fold hydrolase [Hoeflea sp.]|uniref:alpha/beta fold hydrolase n=1 Tax=Hoeflea sp. TaxID=1940281 RepID=UPI003BAF4FCC
MTESINVQRATEDSRAALIDKIYQVVLAPNCYDSFMEEWRHHIDERIAQLQEMRDAEAISDPVLETHFDRAFDILERLGRGAASASETGDAAPKSHVLVSRDGTVQAAGGARGLFRDTSQFSDLEPFFALDSWSRLSSIYADLRRAPQAGRMLVLTLQRAEPEQMATAFWTARTVRDEVSGGIALRLEPLAPGWGNRIDALLAKSFHLTDRELNLVRGLAEGHSLQALSATTGRSLNTLRSQLKSAFQKTGTNTQADLVRLVSTLSGSKVDLPAQPAGQQDEVVTGRLVWSTMADGRAVPVHLIGPDTGIPVIFIHGMLDGIAITSKIHHLLSQYGIRIIAPERPNFGQADSASRLKTAPEEFAGDTAALIRDMGLEDCLLLGHMAGSLYAFAAAGAASQQVRGIVSVAGGVPIRSVRQLALMTPRQRTVAYTARFAPKLLPTVIRAGIAQIDSNDPNAFMKALYPEGCKDRTVVADPHIAAAILDGYRFAVAQGHRAFEIDSYHVTRDWSPLVRKSLCPALILHGAHDPVVNISTVREFADSLGKRATLQVFDDCGQLVFYQKPEQVLASILEFWKQAV